jgi:predicted transcriptional regulator
MLTPLLRNPKLGLFYAATVDERERCRMFHTIGETAGEIWKLLDQEGPLSITAIAGKVKQAQSLVYMGIGWLAREDKLVFTETKRGITISVKK